MLVIIDNYDSFTYNIVQTIAGNQRKDGISEEIKVFRNDKITIKEIEDLAPRRLLISPGPCTPGEAGISIETITTFAGKIPILGVCLGHQSMGEAFGGKTIRASRIMHGKTSPMHHDGRGVFTSLPNPFDGMRYHSLIVDDETLPECFEVTCRTDEGELMGIRHKTLPLEGVQFHPESIMTPAGIQLLKNFMDPNYPDLLK
ncbi:anthranilate synthase component II [Desulfosediminicola flagellatus]|uniref:anthranilate synthase component II n=1 Tax=Desulfosediminicola flagellatus TaxID=2569541 RepID=UPI0010ABC298|nr:aminodeoxychorismate/anthranilate synthase component II [Desulfosediminicola flagellatus]